MRGGLLAWFIVAFIGCEGANDTQLVDCGELAPNLSVVCRSMDPTVETRDSFNGIVQPDSEVIRGALHIDCPIFEPEDKGQSVFVGWEASCHSPLAEPGAVAIELAYAADVERKCGRHDRGSGAATHPTWVASMRLPEARTYTLEVASASSVQTDDCTFRVGGVVADPITVGVANLLLTEEHGPATLDLVFECAGEHGYAALNCYGFDPNTPPEGRGAAAVSHATSLTVIARPAN